MVPDGYLQPFHDAYCLNSSNVFAIGETGLVHPHSHRCLDSCSINARLAYAADITTKLSYLDAMTNLAAKAALSKLVGS